MKFRTALCTALLFFVTISLANAQVASHSNTLPTKTFEPPAPGALMESVPLVPTGRPVVRVNGAVLTDRDLLHEMYALFPYASQHNGFPKGLVGEIRDGAVQMLIFEELVYQEGERRKIPISSRSLQAAEGQLRGQFGSEENFQQYLRAECNGSYRVLRQKIRRSMIIDAMLKREVADKAPPTTAMLRAYYRKHINEYRHKESLHLQTISIIPPPNAGADTKSEARQRAQRLYEQARTAKTYKEFGLLAEKESEDDWHVNMGDRKSVEMQGLPAPVAAALKKLQPGEITPLIQLDDNYTIVRLVERNPAKTEPFQSVRKELATQLTKMRTEELRSQLNQRLHKGAKIEML